MKFRPLFELSLTHNYYQDGRCPDFTIEPTPATEKRLRDHRGARARARIVLRLCVLLFLASARAIAQPPEGDGADSVDAEAVESLDDELLEWAKEKEPEADSDAPFPLREIAPDEWSIEWRNGVRMRRNDGRYAFRLNG